MRTAFMLPAILAFMFLSGCAATRANYTQTAQNLRGANVSQLISQWGKPDIKIINRRGNSVYIYNSNTYRVYPSSQAPVGVHYTGDGKPVIVTPTNMNTWYRSGMSLTCTTLFEINPQGTVISSKISGSGCGASFPSI